jgi:hypothetical protein
MRDFKLLRGYEESRIFTIDVGTIDGDVEYYREQLRRAMSIPRYFMDQVLNMPEQTERNNNNE